MCLVAIKFARVGSTMSTQCQQKLAFVLLRFPTKHIFRFQTSLCVCAHTYVFTCVCAHARMCLRGHACMCILCARLCLRAYAHVYAYRYVYLVSTLMRICAWVCLCAHCMLLCVHVCMLNHVHVTRCARLCTHASPTIQLAHTSFFVVFPCGFCIDIPGD